MADKKSSSLPPSKTGGPVVKTGPTAGQNRSRNDDGRWRGKRSDTGKEREKKSGCFLSTAACKHKGLLDNCRELQTLRAFRDSHLLTNSKGRELVDRYYSIAPAIAARLTVKQANDVWRVVRRCVALIDSGEYINAVDLYEAMVLELAVEHPRKVSHAA